MKEMPQEIWLHNDASIIGATWLGRKVWDNDVEYVHKDAFIEKVCDLLDRMIVDVTYNECDGSLTEHYDKHEFIEEFKECLRNK